MFRKGRESIYVPSGEYETTKERDYQIAICQNGKFAATFDTANLWIKILENTDHRPFKFKKDENDLLQASEKINKTIAHFKIKDNFFIEKFDDNNEASNIDVKGNNETSLSVINDIMTIENQNIKKKNDDKFRWSFDISNVQKRKDVDQYFILVAVSRINVEDMKETTERGYLSKEKYEKTNPNKDENNDSVINFGNGTPQPDKEHKEHKEGTAIYYIKLEKKIDELTLKGNVNIYYSYNVSGICKFVDVADVDVDDESKSENDVEQKRFIILNFSGIYNFKLNDSTFDPFAPKGISFILSEKFEYPKSIRRELDNWYTKDCMKRLRSCIYDKYFMVTQYKNDVQSLEVYNLAKMELETTAKKVENKDKFTRRYNYGTFSVSRLQLCFTRGINRVRLYYIENGLQVASRKFNEMEQIHLLEFIDSDKKILIIGKDSEKRMKFIVWDLYNTDKIILNIEDLDTHLEDLDAHLATTSGNILHVDNKGNVTSVLKKIENKLEELEQKESKPVRKAKCIECNNDEHNNDENNNDGLNNCKYNIYYNEGTIPNFDKVKEDIISNFKKIANEIEPWVLDDYKKSSYCLYYSKRETETEFLQLIVGRSTVQIWHQILDDDDKKKDKLPNKGDPFLEYIWMNGISVDQENKDTKLQIEDFKYGSNDASGKSNYKLLNNFYLKVCWEDKKKKKVIKQKDIIETFHPIRHACKALKHLNKRYIYKCLVDNYSKVHKYEEIVAYVKHIVWRFAKYNPEQFKLLDFRYNFMKNLILGDCDHLIKFILFGDEENIVNKSVSSKEKEKKERKKKQNIRHIPRNVLLREKFIEGDDLDFSMKDDKLKDSEDIKPENNVELAIYHCKGRELKDTIMIAYFLEYYSGHATDCAGWMCTVSKALPLLFKYNYDDYARKLFHKECFADHDHFSAQEPDEIIPVEYLARRNHDIKFRAFRPIVKLKSDQQEWYNIIFESLKSLKDRMYKGIEDFDNDLGKSPLALRVVPLPSFTINNIPKEKIEYNYIKVILNILWFMFIPRWYRIKRNERNKLSPFSRMVLYENNDDIYDNPATEAVIDFRWREAKNFFLFLFIRFLIFAICFGIVSWEYLNHNADINRNFIVASMIIFYYLAAYQLVTEVLQFRYRGTRKYFGEIFSIIDIISIVLSVTVMSIMIKSFKLSNGFGSVETDDTGLIVGISFSIFFLWIELIFYLRLLSRLGTYIYYFVIIFKAVFPFFLFMLIVIFAFGHTMFILLRNSDNFNTKDSSLIGNVTNSSTNETLSIELKPDFDPKSRIDNPFSFFPAAIMAAYFWIDSNWIQRDEFDFWAIDVFTLIISVIVVIFLQNMLIAFMSGVYEKAETKSRQTLLRRRANHIADYEALHHIHFRQHEPEPKYIYYFGQSKTFEDWFDIRKDDQGAIYKGFEEKSTFTRRIFKERDYDDRSILVRDDNIKTEAENIKNDIIEYINEKFNNYNNEINEIEKIQNMKHLIKKLFD